MTFKVQMARLRSLISRIVGWTQTFSLIVGKKLKIMRAALQRPLKTTGQAIWLVETTKVLNSSLMPTGFSNSHLKLQIYKRARPQKMRSSFKISRMISVKRMKTMDSGTGHKALNKLNNKSLKSKYSQKIKTLTFQNQMIGVEKMTRHLLLKEKSNPHNLQNLKQSSMKITYSVDS